MQAEAEDHAEFVVTGHSIGLLNVPWSAVSDRDLPI